METQTSPVREAFKQALQNVREKRWSPQQAGKYLEHIGEIHGIKTEEETVAVVPEVTEEQVQMIFNVKDPEISDRMKQYMYKKLSDYGYQVFLILSDLKPHHKDDLYKDLWGKGFVNQHDLRKAVSDIRKEFGLMPSCKLYIPENEKGKPATYQIKIKQYA